MSQYTHFNISPITQITMQQTFRTIAFVAGEFLKNIFLQKLNDIDLRSHSVKMIRELFINLDGCFWRVRCMLVFQKLALLPTLEWPSSR